MIFYYFRRYQEDQQAKIANLQKQPIGEVAQPVISNGVIKCQLCDQSADADFIEQDVFVCARCADLIANIVVGDFGRSTFMLATWDREALYGRSNNRKQIKASVRTAVYEADEYRCVVCGSAKNLCLDHIIPVSRGGGDEFENLQTLCRSCNNKKGTKTMQEWLGGGNEL